MAERLGTGLQIRFDAGSNPALLSKIPIELSARKALRPHFPTEQLQVQKMQDKIPVGSIIRMEFEYRPEVRTGRGGKVEFHSRKGNGKARNGIVVNHDKDQLVVVPISHSAGKNALPLPRRLKQATEFLDTDEPSYVACDEVNKVHQNSAAVLRKASGKYGSQLICGKADAGTMAAIRAQMKQVALEDAAFTRANAAAATSKNKDVRKVFKAKRPMWIASIGDDPENLQARRKEVLKTLNSPQSQESRNQRAALAGQRKAEKSTRTNEPIRRRPKLGIKKPPGGDIQEH